MNITDPQEGRLSPYFLKRLFLNQKVGLNLGVNWVKYCYKLFMKILYKSTQKDCLLRI